MNPFHRLLEKTFGKFKEREFTGITFVIKALPLSFQSIRTKEMEKTKQEIQRSLREESKLEPIKHHTKNEFRLELIAYFNENYDKTDVDNIAKFVIDCMKEDLFKDEMIKQLYVEKIRSKKGSEAYIGVCIMVPEC